MIKYRIREYNGTWYVQSRCFFIWADHKRVVWIEPWKLDGYVYKKDSYLTYELAKAAIDSYVKLFIQIKEKDYQPKIKSRYINPPLPEKAPF